MLPVKIFIYQKHNRLAPVNQVAWAYWAKRTPNQFTVTVTKAITVKVQHSATSHLLRIIEHRSTNHLYNATALHRMLRNIQIFYWCRTQSEQITGLCSYKIKNCSVLFGMLEWNFIIEASWKTTQFGNLVFEETILFSWNSWNMWPVASGSTNSNFERQVKRI